MRDFLRSYQSEWMKTKRSLALWMVIIGGFFTPAIIIVARLVNHANVPAIYGKEDFWDKLWHSSWESMAVFFLPLGAILTTSLIAQLEYKNNTWKQLHTLPISYASVFFSKLAVILTLMLIFFVLFNIGIYLSALVPYLLISGTPYPIEALPWQRFLTEDAFYFLDCLPIVALQYLLALRFKNFMVPIGLGFMFWVGAIGGVSWRFGYVIPYTYTIFNYLKDATQSRAVTPEVSIHVMAAAYFLVITAVSLILYITKNEKG